MGLLDNLFKPKPKPGAKTSGEDASSQDSAAPETGGEAAAVPPNFHAPKEHGPWTPIQVVPPHAPVAAKTAPAAPVEESAVAELIAFTLSELLPRVPPHFLQSGMHDGRRVLTFRMDELSADLARGRAAVELRHLVARCPDVFTAGATEFGTWPIRLPLQKLVEQIGHLRMERSPQPVQPLPPLVAPVPMAPPESAPQELASNNVETVEAMDELSESAAEVLPALAPEKPLPAAEVLPPEAPVVKTQPQPVEVIEPFRDAGGPVLYELPIEDFADLTPPSSSLLEAKKVALDDSGPQIVPSELEPAAAKSMEGIDERAEPIVFELPIEEIADPAPSGILLVEAEESPLAAHVVADGPPTDVEDATESLLVSASPSLESNLAPIENYRAWGDASVARAASEVVLETPLPAESTLPIAEPSAPVPREPIPEPDPTKASLQEGFVERGEPTPPPAFQPPPDAVLVELPPPFRLEPVPPPAILLQSPLASDMRSNPVEEPDALAPVLPGLIPRPGATVSHSMVAFPPPIFATVAEDIAGAEETSPAVESRGEETASLPVKDAATAPESPGPVPAPEADAAASEPRPVASSEPRMEVINAVPLRAMPDLPDLQRAAAALAVLPGIRACIVFVDERMAQAGDLPSGLEVEAARKAVRYFGGSLTMCGPGLGAGAVQYLSLHGEEHTLSFFMRSSVGICAVHRARVFLPGVRENFTAAAESLARAGG